MHPSRKVVRGQKVTKEKVARSRELRRSMTLEERLLWEQLRDKRLNGLRFRRQQVIEGFIVDFYCDKAALAVELDGVAHAQQREYDEERGCVLAARGVRVLRFDNREAREGIAEVLRTIEVTARNRPPAPARGGTQV